VSLAEKRLRVAVIGLGLIGNRHAWAYEHHPRVDLVCVCDQDSDRARRAAERFGCEAETDFGRVAARADLDLVSVCTPDPDHFEPALAMLQAGHHVLCEKPLTMQYPQAQRLVDEAASRGLTLSVRLPQRYVGAHQVMHERLASGQLGTFVTANVRSFIPISQPTRGFSWVEKTDLHWLYHQHRYDLIRWLTGAEATEVYARGQRGVLTSRGIPCLDAVQVLVTYDNGATTLYDTSWINPVNWRRGALQLDLLYSNGRLATGGEADPTIVVGEPTSSSARPGIVPDPTMVDGILPRNQWQPVHDVAAAILAGVAPPVTARDALAVMAMLTATDLSLKAGRPVTIAEVAG